MWGERAEAGWHWLMSVRMIALDAFAHASARDPAHGGTASALAFSFAVSGLAAVCVAPAP